MLTIHELGVGMIVCVALPKLLRMLRLLNNDYFGLPFDHQGQALAHLVSGLTSMLTCFQRVGWAVLNKEENGDLRMLKRWAKTIGSTHLSLVLQFDPIYVQGHTWISLLLWSRQRFIHVCCLEGWSCELVFHWTIHTLAGPSNTSQCKHCEHKTLDQWPIWCPSSTQHTATVSVQSEIVVCYHRLRYLHMKGSLWNMGLKHQSMKQAERGVSHQQHRQAQYTEIINCLQSYYTIECTFE